MKYIGIAVVALILIAGVYTYVDTLGEPETVSQDPLGLDTSIEETADAPNTMSPTQDGVDAVEEAGSSMSVPVTGDVADSDADAAATSSAVTTASEETAPDMSPGESASGRDVDLTEEDGTADN
ncbi:MAG: hypothetical protein ACU0CI_15360 [Shimia sp.]